MVYRPIITCLVARLSGNELGATVVIPEYEFTELAGQLSVRDVTVDGEAAVELTIVPHSGYPILWEL